MESENDAERTRFFGSYQYSRRVQCTVHCNVEQRIVQLSSMYYWTLFSCNVSYNGVPYSKVLCITVDYCSALSMISWSTCMSGRYMSTSTGYFLIPRDSTAQHRKFYASISFTEEAISLFVVQNRIQHKFVFVVQNSFIIFLELRTE